MSPEDEAQQMARDTTDDSATHIRPSPISRFQAAVDAWKAKAEAEREARFEPLRLEARDAYAEMIRDTQGRDVRSYERGQTPERRRQKKAEKSKAERDGRSPAQIEADKKAARERAAASYERKKAAKAAAEAAQPPVRMEDDPNFARF